MSDHPEPRSRLPRWSALLLGRCGSIRDTSRRTSGIARPERCRQKLVLVLIAMAALVGAPGCTGGAEEGAVHRGDAAFAQGDHAEALAEYRLAIRQGREDVPTLLRAAHAYARVGRIDEARAHYEMAIREDSTAADLAASDLLRVARTAVERSDGIAAAAAVEAAIGLRPGVSLTGLALPLARHFARNAQYGEALPFYQKAIAEEGGESADVLVELALAYQELGDCERALVYFEQARPDVSAQRRGEVDWQIGDCSYQLAMEARDRGDDDEALELFQTTIDLGEPRPRLAQAWFQTGEILAEQGRNAAAIRAFERVIEDNLAEGQFMRDRARERIDRIRFPGRGAARF